MMDPVLIEVVTPMFSSLEIGCKGCGLVLDDLGLRGREREACTEEYPAEWREKMDLLRAWIEEIGELYRDRVRIRLIDAQSPMGLWKQIRHRIHTHPAWIVDKRETYVGGDCHGLKSLIEMRMSSRGRD